MFVKQYRSHADETVSFQYLETKVTVGFKNSVVLGFENKDAVGFKNSVVPWLYQTVSY